MALLFPLRPGGKAAQSKSAIRHGRTRPTGRPHHEILGLRAERMEIMIATYLIVTVLAAAANLFSATCDFVRYKQVSIAMAKAGVPETWMTPLAVLKAAGAVGLLAGTRLALSC